MKKQHIYNAIIKWTGNNGRGTKNYQAYERSHTILIEGKVDINCSSDPSFRGDKSKHNPEELLLSSLSSCHMLWYLHLCAANNVVVEEYIDKASGLMEETESGGGSFLSVTLSPIVFVKEPLMLEKGEQLHKEANKMCFIANSVKFPVYHQPEMKVAEGN